MIVVHAAIPTIAGAQSALTICLGPDLTLLCMPWQYPGPNCKMWIVTFRSILSSVAKNPSMTHITESAAVVKVSKDTVRLTIGSRTPGSADPAAPKTSCNTASANSGNSSKAAVQQADFRVSEPLWPATPCVARVPPPAVPRGRPPGEHHNLLHVLQIHWHLVVKQSGAVTLDAF